jgi:hypothetical protein
MLESKENSTPLDDEEIFVNIGQYYRSSNSDKLLMKVMKLLMKVWKKRAVVMSILKLKTSRSGKRQMKKEQFDWTSRV